MIDANTFGTEQMLTLVAPEPEEIIEKRIEVNQEKKSKILIFKIKNKLL
jgi:hypothetical protein